MRTFLKIWLVVILLAAARDGRAQGNIVQNGVLYGGATSFGDEIQVMHDVANTYYTQFFLNPTGETQPTVYTNNFSFNEFLDVGVRAFLVSPGDAISLQPVLSGSWTELQVSSSYVFQAGVPFYLALYTGSNFAPPYPPEPPYQYLDPVFGWVELENVNGTIQMLGGALEYGGAGIIAGTQTVIQPVPEPGVLGLFGLGWIFVVGRRCQARSMQAL